MLQEKFLLAIDVFLSLCLPLILGLFPKNIIPQKRSHYIYSSLLKGSPIIDQCPNYFEHQNGFFMNAC